MTWSYTPGGTDSLDVVRFLIGDTLTTDQQLQDAEINTAIGQRSTVYGAAAVCCRSLASKFARSVTFKSGQSSANFSDLYKAYLAMAINFEAQAALSGGGTPYAGGISQADMLSQVQNGDRVPSVFTIGMDDNLLPVGPVGPETQSSGQGDGDEE